MSLVVDCSVALKWVLMEEGRPKALGLLGQSLWAPDFLMLECANVLATKARTGVVDPHRAVEALEEISERSGLQWRPTTLYVARVQALALRLRQSAYDCLYLAMAIQDGRTLITADGRFAQAVEQDALYRMCISRL